MTNFRERLIQMGLMKVVGSVSKDRPRHVIFWDRSHRALAAQMGDEWKAIKKEGNFHAPANTLILPKVTVTGADGNPHSSGGGDGHGCGRSSGSWEERREEGLEAIGGKPTDEGLSG